MKKIRLAVIGTGMAWNRLHLPAIQELKEEYEVVALADPNETVLQNSANKIQMTSDNLYTDYKKMLMREDIDAVIVAVPIDNNYLVSKDVLEAGKNLICEKPLAPNIKQGIEFINLQKEKNLKVLIAENYRYNEEHNLIKMFIEEKRIGDVLYFIKNNAFIFEEDMIQNTFGAKEWRQHPTFEGGIFLDGGVHDIAGLRYIFGDYDAVSAFGKPLDKDYSPYSVLSCNFMFKSGVTGQYTYCCTTKDDQKPPIGFRIIGTKGTIYLEDKYSGVISIYYDDGRHESHTFAPQRGYYNEFKNFYNAFYNNEEINVTPMVEFGDEKVIFAILNAAKEQRVIKVDSTTQFITEYTSTNRV
ncbi:putative dehydrogenase [Natranaerovirga pectinivora]|uniref:Putative dehydrogenase n=1 Tax=Natranaerovirga pectinivora TaxID=682400 RepID=A0A4R3MLM1_9FIRM|nr:Gfo/Idh/MocA family oxidoreductase [Natranaerovirga pectinivora]TCT15548.1 putative dehydrogenase [Natranaerovirga pectinivora]